MIQLDFSAKIPLYEQVKEKIKNLIITGALKTNEKIPSVRELAGSLTINPNTIQRAYKELEDEGFIFSQPAKGSFVAPLTQKTAKAQLADLYQALENTLQALLMHGEAPERIDHAFNVTMERLRKEQTI